MTTPPSPPPRNQWQTKMRMVRSDAKSAPAARPAVNATKTNRSTIAVSSSNKVAWALCRGSKPSALGGPLF